MMEGIVSFLKALPELLQLYRELRARIEEAGIERQVAQDVKTIHEAFGAKDATKLNDLFKSASSK